jgi:hypothetical protein
MVGDAEKKTHDGQDMPASSDTRPAHWEWMGAEAPNGYDGGANHTRWLATVTSDKQATKVTCVLEGMTGPQKRAVERVGANPYHAALRSIAP